MCKCNLSECRVSRTLKRDLSFLRPAPKFGLLVMFLACFWYFKLILIFRGPIYQQFKYLENIWQPWKWNLTPYYCSGSLKTYKSEFCFSGFPKFDSQGCHISLGCNCPNSIPAQDDEQITSLKHPTVGIHGKFYWWHFVVLLQKLKLVFGQTDGRRTDGRTEDGRTDGRGSWNSYLDFC